MDRHTPHAIPRVIKHTHGARGRTVRHGTDRPRESESPKPNARPTFGSFVPTLASLASDAPERRARARGFDMAGNVSDVPSGARGASKRARDGDEAGDTSRKDVNVAEHGMDQVVSELGFVGAVPRMKWVDDDEECEEEEGGSDRMVVVVESGRQRGAGGGDGAAGREAAADGGGGQPWTSENAIGCTETGAYHTDRVTNRADTGARSVRAGTGAMSGFPVTAPRGGSPGTSGLGVGVSNEEAGRALASMIVEDDAEELKKLKRKESNRESARRSRLRKQTENEILSARVRALTRENVTLKENYETLRGVVDSLRAQNINLREELADIHIRNGKK